MQMTTTQLFAAAAQLSPRQAHAAANAYYTVTELKQRGWTRRLIERFLGTSDSQTQNPHFKRGRPMRYFETQRVHHAESGQDFEEETEVSLYRKQAAQKVVLEKTQALVDLAATADPALPGWSAQELDAQAYQIFGNPVDELALNRAQISALMQFCSSCEWMLDDYFWHPGIRAARLVIRRKVLAKIIQAYPHLNDLALDWAKKEKGNAEIDIFVARVVQLSPTDGRAMRLHLDDQWRQDAD